MRKFSNNDLIEYAEGRLNDEQATAIEVWIAENPAAQELLESWRATRAICTADDSVAPPASLTAKLRSIFEATPIQQPESWFSKLQHVIASLTFDSRLQPLAVRSSVAEMVELSFEADGIEIDLQCTLVEADEDRWNVIGQVSSAAGAILNRLALCKSDSNESVVEATIDDRGVFQMQCRPGAFALIIEADDRAVRTPAFELN